MCLVLCGRARNSRPREHGLAVGRAWVATGLFAADSLPSTSPVWVVAGLSPGWVWVGRTDPPRRPRPQPAGGPGCSPSPRQLRALDVRASAALPGPRADGPASSGGRPSPTPPATALEGPRARRPRLREASRRSRSSATSACLLCDTTLQGLRLADRCPQPYNSHVRLHDVRQPWPSRSVRQNFAGRAFVVGVGGRSTG